LGVQCGFRLYQLITDMINMHLAKEFYVYLESPIAETEGMPFYPVLDDGMGASAEFMWKRHKGFCIVILMVLIKTPSAFIDEKFYNVLCNFLHKLRYVQRAIVHNKILTVSSATNKTIS
jgi:hypothetical protein